jgi:outer membrane receptor for Fe3+-dicitrate
MLSFLMMFQDGIQDLTLVIKNVTDERFITSRRPQGIRVGIPRFITAGYEFRF